MPGLTLLEGSMKYTFITTCQDTSTCGDYGEAINEMVQSPHQLDIDSKNFLKIAKSGGIHDEILEMFDKDSEDKFTKDWGIECNKSHFQGIDCLYVRASGIEHIFVDSSRYNEIKHSDSFVDRLKILEALDEKLDQDEKWNKASNPKEEFDALSDFVAKNIDEMNDNNILLASLFAYGHSYIDMVKKIDKTYFLSSENSSDFDLN